MENIKLRVWDKEQNKFLEINWEDEDTRFTKGKANIRYSTEEGIYATLSGYVDEDGWDYEIRGDILQYTGLKDSTGKEIYNKYILEGLYQKKCNSDYIKVIGTVDLKFGAFRLKCTIDDSIKWIPLYRISDLKVLGNIYENKDLLGGYE